MVFELSGLATNMAASAVLGQQDFVTNNPPWFGLGAANMTQYNLDYDNTGSRLFVRDTAGVRILVFNTATVTTNENAINVLGTSNFTSNVGSETPVINTWNSSITYGGLLYNSGSGQLFSVDNTFNRVMVFDAAVAAEEIPELSTYMLLTILAIYMVYLYQKTRSPLYIG